MSPSKIYFQHCNIFSSILSPGNCLSWWEINCCSNRKLRPKVRTCAPEEETSNFHAILNDRSNATSCVHAMDFKIEAIHLATIASQIPSLGDFLRDLTRESHVSCHDFERKVNESTSFLSLPGLLQGFSILGNLSWNCHCARHTFLSLFTNRA